MLHDLRHFYASGLISENCDVVTVQRALGHSSPSITLNTHAHLWPNANERTRKSAANLSRRWSILLETKCGRTAAKYQLSWSHVQTELHHVAISSEPSGLTLVMPASQAKTRPAT
ncbi:tyrosine-type recombinase/integrase [Mycobacteriaceae bacterium NPDC060252]